MTERCNHRAKRSEVLDEEIRWLASFGWSNRTIARQLHLSISTVEKHLDGREREAHAHREH